MYGIPATLDLSRFVGAELIQLCAGQFQCQFHFDPPTSICVERRWELRDESGQLLWKAPRPGLSTPQCF
jgi:hypothetical protein